MAKITVKDTEVTVIKANEEDYICITDMAKFKESEVRAADVIKNWIRNRTTLEFLGTWEQMYNPDFKVVEFDHFKIRIIHLLPCSKKFKCSTISYPVFYYICCTNFALFKLCHICNTDIIFLIRFDNCYLRVFYRNFCHSVIFCIKQL